MAGFAGGGKTSSHVVWTRGCFEFRGVAGIALRGHRLKFAGRPSLMTGIAVHSSVSPSQRKAVIVLLHLPNRDLPSPYGVALLAICAQLPPVNVGVAVLAALSDIGENWPDVALSAVHRLVHAAQRIFRLVVIEFRNAADRFPCGRCVAVLTRQAQVSVRTMCSPGYLCMCALRSCRKREHQNSKQPENAPGPEHGRPRLNARHQEGNDISYECG